MIEFRQVGKVYSGGVEALRDVNFLVEDGEFVFCIGESGAGKSTLIRLLTCEERPTTGSVIVDNYEVNRLERRLIPYLRRKIGIIYQDFRLIDTKTVFENVAFAMEIVGADRKTIKQRVSMVLSLVGLRKRADNYPPELSGGEAQRVGIARAMVNNPRLILADEPTGNLDPANSEAIMALLEEINRAGTTIIACTHDVNLVNKMKKRVIALDDGILVRDENSAGYAAAKGAACYLHDRDDLQHLKGMLENDTDYDDMKIQREAEEYLHESEARFERPDEAEEASDSSDDLTAANDTLAAAKEEIGRKSKQNRPRRRRMRNLSLAERIARLQVDACLDDGETEPVSEAETEGQQAQDLSAAATANPLPRDKQEAKEQGHEDE